MKLSNTQKEYLKTIYILESKEKIVRLTEIAKKLNKTKSTVNYAINNLKKEGLINYEVYGNISLTELGTRQAIKILEAYDIVYLFLKEILNLETVKAESEAERMKESLSDETLNKLAVYVHKTLGLYSLECGYDIDNYRCIKCPRRTNKKGEN